MSTEKEQMKDSSSPEEILDGVGPSKLLDLLVGKQAQFYTLWGVYTAVQFTAGGFGSKDLSAGVAYAVIAGVWAFNFGHLGFVLSCARQISTLQQALRYRLAGNTAEYTKIARTAIDNMDEAAFFWRFYAIKTDRSKYIVNTLTHFFIDSCASLVLLIRAGIVHIS